MDHKGIRASIIFALKSKGYEPKNVDIESIPLEWDNFPDSDDLWVDFKLPESENASSCLYVLRKKSEFPPHIHKVAEQFCIINPTGKVRVYTPSRIFTVSYPNGVHFDINEPHIVEGLEETKILCIWRPKFSQGWKGDFINNESK
jgi:quercetin dioxygenase-like cupin family protein